MLLGTVMIAMIVSGATTTIIGEVIVTDVLVLGLNAMMEA